MKKFMWLIISAMLVFSMSTTATAENVLEAIQKRGTLLVGLEAGYMPFEMRDKKGDIVGFDVDMTTAMAKAMGVKVKYVNTNWEGIIPALLTKKFDIIASGMTITQGRNLRVNFANPYITVGQTVVLNKKTGKKSQVLQETE